MSDRNKALSGIKDLINYLGVNPKEEGMLKTPERVLKYFENRCAGYNIDPKDILSTKFKSGDYKDFVLLKNIEFQSTCEHHLLPIIGVASIAYFPKDKVVGISKLARLLNVFAERLQLQERMTQEIGQALDKFLPNNGVAVQICATHYCMKINGVKKQHSKMYTYYSSGIFKSDELERRKFSEMVNSSNDF